MIRTWGMSPTVGVRKRTIEDDERHAGGARHWVTASDDRTANATPHSLLLEWK